MWPHIIRDIKVLLYVVTDREESNNSSATWGLMLKQQAMNWIWHFTVLIKIHHLRAQTTSVWSPVLPLTVVVSADVLTFEFSSFLWWESEEILVCYWVIVTYQIIMITVLSVTQVFQNHTHTQLTHKYFFLKINPKTSLILERYSATKLYPSPLSLLYVFFKIYCQELLFFFF